MGWRFTRGVYRRVSWDRDGRQFVFIVVALQCDLTAIGDEVDDRATTTGKGHQGRTVPG